MNPAVISATSDGQQPGRDEAEAELGERRLDVGGGEHEVQVGRRRLAGRRRPAPARPASVCHAIAELPLADELAQVRRELVERAEQARRACTGCRRRSPRSCRRRRAA